MATHKPASLTPIDHVFVLLDRREPTPHVLKRAKTLLSKVDFTDEEDPRKDVVEAFVGLLEGESLDALELLDHVRRSQPDATFLDDLFLYEAAVALPEFAFAELFREAVRRRKLSTAAATTKQLLAPSTDTRTSALALFSRARPIFRHWFHAQAQVAAAALDAPQLARLDEEARAWVAKHDADPRLARACPPAFAPLLPFARQLGDPDEFVREWFTARLPASERAKLAALWKRLRKQVINWVADPENREARTFDVLELFEQLAADLEIADRWDGCHHDDRAWTPALR